MNSNPLDFTFNYCNNKLNLRPPNQQPDRKKQGERNSVKTVIVIIFNSFPVKKQNKTMRLKMSVVLKATFYPAELPVYLFGG